MNRQQLYDPTILLLANDRPLQDHRRAVVIPISYTVPFLCPRASDRMPLV